ncbi:chemotaxis protein CheD [Psychrobium sp. 1_MG-2023]|uniref:chemotaxis protein CheD n=1 Tax=Psychrobium sp. 1_MG-2023 TaxID=3062624 RepID=UPI000C332083|nr:chemotaxis protein CheD [Psychrobium sp. 1_MG-2023]MDP2560151.1 chemoreceptor glutamine deamidase CheD [Psychrobium sp. 1_MG-2023]PKF56964.1 chemotaxis protein CheD [Alteromonadales bacterium alter-6D02]
MVVNAELGVSPFKEFKHIRRFWMPRHQKYGVKIVAGDYYVSDCDEMITTVLGSCVTVCIRDPAVAVGGINHFILPDSDCDILSASNRYGVFAMEQLINTIVKYGGNRNNFEIKLVGGGNMLGGTNHIGQRNIDFIRSFLKLEGFNVIAEDLGGDKPRKIMYNVVNGKLLVNKLKCQHHDKYLALELETQRKNRQLQSHDDIELFD